MTTTRNPTDWKSDAMCRRIARRYAAERRFRLAGLAAVLLMWGPDLLTWSVGAQWSGAGALARGLGLYIGLLASGYLAFIGARRILSNRATRIQ